MNEDVCDGNGRATKTRPFHGCRHCCNACLFSTHACPGCGADLNHGIDVCLRCRNRKD